MKKAMSLFLGSVLVLNTAAMVKIKANDTSVAEAKELRDSIIEKLLHTFRHSRMPTKATATAASSMIPPKLSLV